MGLLVAGGLLIALVGAYAPASFMAHFIVFALACFVGFQVIWSVSHSLHTPLMAVTNAISGIVVLGALLQVGSSHWLVSEPGLALLPDRHHQHRRRLPGHPPDAGHVPEVVRIVR